MSSLPALRTWEIAPGWSEGLPPPFVDGQIAAIARVNDLILVTANRTDVGRFEDLRVENWKSARAGSGPAPSR